MAIPFRPLARLLTRLLHPTPRLDLDALRDFLPALGQVGQAQGVVVTINHFNAPDFHVWWSVILVSALIPRHVHWVVSSGWTNSGWLTGFTHWLFPLGARLLGFTPMPAMPPDPSEAEARALAVRQVLFYARNQPQPVIGMSPEGGDSPGGVLADLPPGVGRFMQLLSLSCPTFLPVGVWKENGCIQAKFGQPYQLALPAGLSSALCDSFVGDLVMRHIAECLPPRFRGRYQ